MTAVTGAYFEGQPSATEHVLTVPVGVTPAMSAVIAVATGSSAPVEIALAAEGAAFDQLDERTAGNERVAVFVGHGLTAGAELVVSTTEPATVSVGHHYTNEWSAVDTAYPGVRDGSADSVTSGACPVVAGQRVFVVASDRTTGASAIRSVVTSGGEAVSQISFGAGPVAQSSLFLGYFTAGSTGERTVTITYADAAPSGYAALIPASSPHTAVRGVVQSMGKTSAPASSSSSSADKTAVSQSTAPQAGTLTAAHAHLWLSASGSASVRYVVYSDSSGAPGTLLATSDPVSVTATADTVYDFTFTGTQRIAITSGTAYWHGVAWADPGTLSITYGRDNTASGRQEASSNAPGSFGTGTVLSGPLAAYADIDSAATGGGGGGPAVGPFLPAEILRLHAAGGNNHFNEGIGYTSGHVDKTPSELEAGFNQDPYFFAKTNVDGLWCVQFHAPLDGGTTSSGTAYARSELREMGQGATDNSNRAAWDPTSGDHWIEAWLRPTSLPPNKPQVCVMQAHDPNDDTIMILTQKVNNVLTLRLRYGGSDTGLPVLDPNYVVGREFYTKIRLINGKTEIYYYSPATGKGSMTTPTSTTTQFSSAGSGWYYKSGCYNQSNETIDSSGTFKVEMRDLRHWHTGWTTPLAPWSTTVSGGAAPTVSAGADASGEAGAVFTRTATETGTITSRQWKIVSGPVGAGSVISTSSALSWVPTTAGSYVLGYYGTYNGGTAYDELVLTVTTPTTGGGGTGGTSGGIWPDEFPDGTPYDVILAGTNIVNVSDSTTLAAALANATAGDRIRLASGTYSGSFTLSAKQGTSTAGISIEAATVGGAQFASGSSLTITSCRQVTVSGLVFPWEGTGGNQHVKIGGSSTLIRLTRCTFGPTGSGTPAGSTETWNYVYAGDQASHCRIDHCEFRQKGTGGNCVRVYGDFNTNIGSPYFRVDHNYFRDIGPQTENDKEPIRLGVSAMSRTDGHHVVERNLFVNCTSEPELTSIKMGDCRVSGNVYLNCAGSSVIRHGRNSIQSDNYFVDTIGVTASAGMRSGGSRMYDSGHTIRNNYYGGLQGSNFQAPILLDTGDAEGASTNLAGHWRVIDATVQWNFVTGCATGIQVGDNYSTNPADCVVTDNLVSAAASGAALTYIGATVIESDPSIGSLTTTVARNTYAATPGGHGAVLDADGIWRKAGYGPRVSWLRTTDVGPTGDTADTDGTGAGISSGGTTGAPTVNIGADITVESGSAFIRSATETGSGIFARTWTLVSGPGAATGGTVDTTTAAGVNGWGTPHLLSDDFPGTAVDGTKWSVYSGPGHDGNGTRNPARAAVSGGKLILTGLAGAADTAGMAHKLSSRYGRWEFRARSISTGGGGGGVVSTPWTPNWYVAPSGSDSNSGTTSTSPLRTIQAAISKASGGQTIGLMDGTYTGNLVIAKGGGTSAKITIRAINFLKAVISGNDATSNESAVEINAAGIRLEDLTITGASGSGVRNGVLINADNVDVVHCEIYNICQFKTGGTSWQGGAGIDFWKANTANVLVERCHIHHIGAPGSTEQLVHGIYVGVHGTNLKIRSNYIHHCEDFGVQPYDETEASNIEIYYNSIHDTGRGILQGPSGKTYGNYVYNVRGYHYDIRGSGNSGGQNYYGGTGSGITGASFASSLSNPGWVAYSSSGVSDPRLTATSALIDKGGTTGMPPTDYDGVPRPQGSLPDVGAFERQVATAANTYHPVIEVWPDSDSTLSGEYTIMENSAPAQTTAEAYWHYPGSATVQQIHNTKPGVDQSQFHNFAFEWSDTGLKSWIDGVLWATASGGATSTRDAIQAMPEPGHLTIQLDAFDPSGLVGAQMEVDWVNFYPIGGTSSTPTGGTELATGTSTLNWTAPPTVGDYVIRYTAENSSGIGADTVTVHVVAPGGATTDPAATAPPVFVGVGASLAGKQATIDPGAAAGAKAGDFEIIAILSAGDETMSSVPAGWSLLDAGTIVSATTPVDRGGPCTAWIYYTTTQAGQAAVFTKSGTRFVHAVRAAWRGQSSLGAHALLIDAVDAADASHPVAPISAARANSMAVSLVVADLLNAAFGPVQAPAGWTSRYDSTKTSATENETISIADQLVQAGLIKGAFASTNADESGVFSFILEGPNPQDFARVDRDTSSAVETASVTITSTGSARPVVDGDTAGTAEGERLNVSVTAPDTVTSTETPGAGVVSAALASIEWVAVEVTGGKLAELAVPTVAWFAVDPLAAVDTVDAALLLWEAQEVTGGRAGGILTPIPLAPQRVRPRLIAQSILDDSWVSLELPVNDPEITWQLSGATAITAHFAPELASVVDLGLEPWGTWIYLEEDNEIRAAGILQPVAIDTDGKLSLSALGPHAYAKRVPYRARFSGIRIDPADAVRVMWDHIQAFPRGDLGVTIEGRTPITIGTEPRDVEFVTGEGEEVSFTAGPYTLDYWQNTLVGSEVEKLGGDTPFDFIENCRWNSTRNAVDKWITIHYPSAGWRRTDLRFAQGENIVEFAPVAEPDDAYADVVYVQGKGEGVDKIAAEAEQVVGGRIRLPAIVDDKTIDSKQRATATAKDELAARLASLVEVPEIVCDARHRNAPVGSFVPGDDIFIQVIYPYVGVVAAWHRVTAITYLPWQNRMKLALTRRGEFRQ